MKKLFFCLLLSSTAVLPLAGFSNAPSIDPYILSSLTADPALLVHGCVNAITGDLIFPEEKEIVIEAFEPIVIPKSYCSKNRKNDLSGWGSIPHLRIPMHGLDKIVITDPESGIPFLYSFEPVPSFNHVKHQKKYYKETHTFTLDKDNFLSGFAQSYTTESKNRLNVKSNRITYCLKDATLIIYGISGRISYYQLNKEIPYNKKKDDIGIVIDNWKNSDLCWLLTMEKLPNGNELCYSYDGNNRLRYIHSVIRNSHEFLHFARAEFHYIDPKSEQGGYALFTSDGKQHGHHVTNFSGKFFLSKALRAEAPDETYEYLKGDDKPLCSRNWPDDRKLKIEYYVQAQYITENQTVNITSQSDPCYMRVKTLLAPVGKDQQLLPIYNFVYHPGEVNKTGGYTEVFDSDHNKTIYRYSPYLRVESIERYSFVNGTYQLKNSERFFWGMQGSNEAIFLVGKTFFNENDDPIFSRRFFYDDRGNLTKEIFYGDISGKGSSIIELDADGGPKEGTECFQKTREYNNHNRITKETDDSGVGLQYFYDGESDRISAKFILDKGIIKKRYFYGYYNTAVIEEIVDDGINFDKNSLEGVSERKITRFEIFTEEFCGQFPSKEAGKFPYFPKTIIESYLDLKTKKEKLLRKTGITYSNKGKIIQKDIYDSEDKLVYSLKYQYDNKGRLISETNPLNQKAEYQYDANSNKIFSKNFQERFSSKYQYDFANRLIQKEDKGDDGICHSASFAYDKKNNLLSSTDLFGNNTTCVYDSWSHPLEMHSPEISGMENTLFCISKASYDALGRKVSTTTPNGDTTHTIYNSCNQPIKIVYPDESCESFVYNTDGTLASHTDQEGITQSYSYDFAKRKIRSAISKEKELLSEESWNYNTFHLCSYTDPEKRITSYEYDGAGRKSSEESCGEKKEFFYDELGRHFKTTIHNGDNSYSSVKKFDLLDRVIEEKIEDTNHNILTDQIYAYDATGNKTEEISFVGSEKVKELWEYDSLRRVISHTDTMNHRTLVSYKENATNSLGQNILQKTETDPLGIETITTYNSHNQIFSIEKKSSAQKPLSLEQYFFDGNGNKTDQISTIYYQDRVDKKTHLLWKYDTQNRTTQITEAVGSTLEKTTRFTYTKNGKLAQTIKPDGVIISNTYNDLGHLIELKTSDHSVFYQNRYDKLGRLLESKDLRTDVGIERKLNIQGQIEEEKLSYGPLLKFSYDAIGRKTSLTLPDGSAIRYEYGPIHLLSVARMSSSGSELYSHSYTQYDLSGHVLQSVPIGDGGEQNFSYDALGRVSSVISSYYQEKVDSYDPVGRVTKRIWPDHSVEYAYDELGQLINEKGLENHSYSFDSHYNRRDKDTHAYVVDDLNRLQSTQEFQVEYDLNGNPIKKKFPSGKEIIYHYDGLDRLVSVEEANHFKESYEYDFFHRRIKKSTQVFENGEEKNSFAYFLYDGQKDIGSCDANNALLELRVLGNSSHAEIGATVAIELNGNLYRPIHDLMSNIVGLVSLQDHQIKNRLFYSSFGEETIGDKETAFADFVNNPWGFASKRKDPITGLIYFGRRYYDSDIGRWLTPDPKGFTDGINLYAYVLNDPLGKIDEYGLWSIDWGRYGNMYNNTMLDTSFDLPCRQPVFKGPSSVGDMSKNTMFDTSFDTTYGEPLSKASYYPPAPRYFDLGRPEPPHGGRIVLSPGMYTNSAEARHHALYLSDLAGGVNCHWFECPKVLGSHFQGTNTVLANFMKNEMEKTYQGTGKPICLVGHSEGVKDDWRMLQLMEPQMRKNIMPLNIAPAKAIPWNLARNPHNYQSFLDPIPRAGDFFSWGKNLHEGNLVMLPPAKGAGFFDHDFESPTYRKVLRDEINDYLELCKKMDEEE